VMEAYVAGVSTRKAACPTHLSRENHVTASSGV
jgi:hypothetical protein